MGASLTFNGTSSRINCGNDSSVGNLWAGGATAVAWVYATGSGDGGFGRVFDKVNSGNSIGWRIYQQPISTTPRMTFQQYRSLSNGSWYTDTEFQFDQWIYLWITYDSDLTANNPSIYFDGSLLAITEYGGAPSGPASNDNSQALNIGASVNGTREWDGELCHMQLWDTVLSTDEMFEATYKPGSVRTNLQGYWPLIEGTSTALDLSGNGNTGSTTNMTDSFDGPPIRSA